MKRMQLLRKLTGTTWGANTNMLRKTYLGYVRPVLEYGIAAGGTCSNAQLNKAEKVQNHCMRIVSGAMKSTPIRQMESYIGIKSIAEKEMKKSSPSITK